MGHGLLKKFPPYNSIPRDSFCFHSGISPVWPENVWFLPHTLAAPHCFFKKPIRQTYQLHH
jgi:hypothetical protein